MCYRPYVGKLAALSAKGQAHEGSELTHKPDIDNYSIDSNVEFSLSTVCNNDVINLLAVNPAKAYHIVGIVSKVRVSFMLDTGASVSLLNNETWKQLSVNNSGEATALQPWGGSQLVGVEGSPIVVQGVATIDIILPGQVVSTDILVARGLNMQAILGLDFLEKHQCVINTEQRILHMHGRAIPLQSKMNEQLQPDSGVSTITVALQRTVELPPLSELEVMTVTSSPTNSAPTWLVEALPRESPIVVASSVVTPVSDGHHTTIPMRIANFSTEAVTLYKGSKIGKASPLDDKVNISSVKPDSDSHVSSTDEDEIPLHKQELLWDLVTKSGDSLTTEQQHELYNALLGYADVFTANEDDLGRTDVLKHTISVGDASPIRQPPRRAPPYHKETVRNLLSSMLSKGVIQPSKSPWASPVVLVKKKDGTVRFCVDYRKVNAVTTKDAFPLPRIDDTLDTLSGSQWFSTLDMLSGYWQVEMDEKDREKTAFTTHEGLFEFKVMPFGLCNAPATFQRLMNVVLAGVQWSKCLVYLDDIIIVGRTFNEHLKNLGIVLQRLREANLRLKPNKCTLCRDEVLYLGHVVSRHGVATDPTKTDKVSKWPAPNSVKEVQQFLGLASYYRRFVRNFAVIAKPLYRLTERGRQFQWTKECSEAFAVLKHRLTTSPVLSYPDFAKPFILDTDASYDGIGAVLSQQHEGKEVVVAYASRTLSKSERKYCVTRKELLAAVKFIQHFRPYLLGNPFVLRTDHGSLTWLQNFKEPEGQLARWIEQLQEYHFEIVHRPGKRHSNADSLSRRPCNQCHRLESHCGNEGTHQVAATSIAERERSTTDIDLQTAQSQDDIIGPVLQAKEAGCKPIADTLKGHRREVTQLTQQWDQLVLQHGVLYRKFEKAGQGQLHFQLVVPKDHQASVLQEIHGGRMGGHLGEDRTFKKLQERFYWPGYFQSSKEWCQNCPHCAAKKGPTQKHRGPLQNIRCGYPMQMVAADIVGPFPRNSNGNRYILVVSDYFTRWAEAYAIPNQEAKTIANRLVDNMFCRFGIPEQLHTDKGAQFESTLVKEVSKLLKINKTHTTAYHPQGDGLVERLNRTILAMLATVTDEQGEDWESHLAKVCFAYNTSEHVSTGYSPFYMMYGRKAKIPLDIIYGNPNTPPVTPLEYVSTLRQSLEQSYQLARKHSLGAACRQKEHYDKKVHGEPYEKGDLVWLFTPVVGKHKAKKLHCPWTGPYRIIKRISDLVYRIQDTGSRRRQVVNFERLKPCPQQMRDRSQPGSGTQDSQVQNTIEEDSINTPPGTVLQLVDDYEEEEVEAPEVLLYPQSEDRNNLRRYPQRRNRRKPLRYQDGVP